MSESTATATAEPVSGAVPAYKTVELIIPMELYRRAQFKAQCLGEDMAHVARRILYAAVERDPVGPAPAEDPTPPPDTEDGMHGGLSYTPNVVPGAVKTRDNTRGEDAAYKNFRFRVPRHRYPVIKAQIVGVPGQTVTHVLEQGLLRYAATGIY